MKAVLLGATKGMGRSLAQAMAARGDHLCLLGRDADALAKGARDLQIRGAPEPVSTVPCDLAERGGFDAALDAADAALGGFDTVILTAGMFAQQDALEDDPDKTADMLNVNFTNSVMFCEAARKRLLARGGGTLCVFSSVAGDRARKPVVLYGASKAGLSYYLEGLDHKFHAEGLTTILVKPGFVKTSMTAGLDPPPFSGEPEDVALTVLAAIDKGTPVVYAPGMWWLVMLVIRNLPRMVMRRIGF
jgi:decaprenylphospho-beta-D-erythro-pentofuranosid-2-ulose 2-reductase